MMGWPLAVAMLCKYYGWTVDYVSSLTLGQVRNLIDRLGDIFQLEAGKEVTKPSKPLEGKAAEIASKVMALSANQHKPVNRSGR